MIKIQYDELEKDKKGRIRECHFCISKNKNYVCTALEKFYNFEDKTDMCGKCPFFKTDAEFIKGWNKPSPRGEGGPLAVDEVEYKHLNRGKKNACFASYTSSVNCVDSFPSRGSL